jgi:hypothetical protein
MLKQMYEQYLQQTKDTPLSFEDFSEKIVELLSYITNLVRKNPDSEGGTTKVSENCHMHMWLYKEGFKLAFTSEPYVKEEPEIKLNAAELF